MSDIEPPRLRRARVEDAADFAALMGDPEVYPATLQLPLPSEALWRERLKAQELPTSTDFQLVAEQAGRVLACAGLHPAPQTRRRHVASLGICVASQAQGQGVGRLLMQALCDYADGWGHLLRIELSVFTDNARAIALYQAFGFRHEGTHRGFALRDGVYADVFTMARLHPRPPQLGWPGG